MGKWYHWWGGWLFASSLWIVGALYSFEEMSLIYAISLLAGTFILGVLILFIHDRFQTVNPIQRRFPVLYWGRWIAVHLGPLLRQYWFANDLEEKPFN